MMTTRDRVPAATGRRERPLNLDAPAVRAFLGAGKSQIRRAISPQPAGRTNLVEWNTADQAFVPWYSTIGSGAGGPSGAERTGAPLRCPYGSPGDRLWVRETWCQAWDDRRGCWHNPLRYLYRADGREVRHLDGGGKSPWSSSSHMPRVASRLVLELVSARAERLQDVDEAGARAEGFAATAAASARDAFRRHWEATKGAWDDNLWVWVGDFAAVVSR